MSFTVLSSNDTNIRSSFSPILVELFSKNIVFTSGVVIRYFSHLTFVSLNSKSNQALLFTSFRLIDLLCYFGCLLKDKNTENEITNKYDSVAKEKKASMIYIECKSNIKSITKIRRIMDGLNPY